MFDREGSSVVNHVDISSHQLYLWLWCHTARVSPVIAHDTLNVAYGHWRGLDESAIQKINTVTRQTRKPVAQARWDREQVSTAQPPRLETAQNLGEILYRGARRIRGEGCNASEMGSPLGAKSVLGLNWICLEITWS
jgi:hypothetical protein